ncbi:potassium channel family protein, partial [bacterium]|nr:potassium channel family protein [bacterium]
VDRYYYLEMVAKRKHKHFLKRYPELLVQYLFGYGTKWQPVMLSWFAVVFGSALIYWLGGGVATSLPDIKLNWWRYIYFSISTVTTLGYGDYHPVEGFEILACIEAIFGTFIWAAFITIFARKYMR